MITPPRRTSQKTRAISPWDRNGRDEEEETRKYQKETKRKAVPLTSVLFVEQTPGGGSLRRGRRRQPRTQMWR